MDRPGGLAIGIGLSVFEALILSLVLDEIGTIGWPRIRSERRSVDACTGPSSREIGVEEMLELGSGPENK